MGLFNDGQPPPLFVPDLSKPATAAVDADGNVTCIQCKTKLPLSRADVVGQGYRCPACSARAEISQLSGGPSDISANLSHADRRGMHNAGMALIVPGVLMIVGGVVLFGVIPGARLPIYLVIAGIMSAGAGLAKTSAAK
jgi:hypothetical protein